MQQEKKDLIYLYCIVKSKPACSGAEEFGVKTRSVYVQGIYAIVSYVSPDEFNEENLKKNLADMEWVEKNVRQHEKIIEKIMKDIPVIPFKFGTIFKTEEGVKNLINNNNLKFKNMIAGLSGKEERGLKIYCDKKHFTDELSRTNERIKDRDKEIASAGKGKAYFLKKKKNEFVKGIINDEISEYTRDCFERLKRTVVDAKITKILPKAVTEKKEDMVLNAAFLIDKKRLKEFEEVLTYLKTKYSDKGLIFDYTGPWPPYNFCQIKPGLTERSERKSDG